MRGATDFMADIAAMIRKQVMDAVPTFRWATVTSVNPLRIRFDGETDPLPITPDTLVNPPVGARVFVLHWMRRVTVLGRAGGVPDTGWVTSGLSITAETGWTVQSYILRKVGEKVTGSVVLERTGATLTPNPDGNFTDSPCFVMPEGWRITRPWPVQSTLTRTGVMTAFGRFETSPAGMFTATHGIPGQPIDQGSSPWHATVDYFTD